MEGGEMGEEPRGSTPPPSPTTRRNVLAVALGAAKMLPPALTTSVNPGASVGILTHRPRAHAPGCIELAPDLPLKILAGAPGCAPGAIPASHAGA